jgi:hypothetical protein
MVSHLPKSAFWRKTLEETLQAYCKGFEFCFLEKNLFRLFGRAEPSRAEPSRAEPSRADSRAEPSRAEPSRAETRAEPSRAETRAEPSRAEPNRAEPIVKGTKMILKGFGT